MQTETTGVEHNHGPGFTGYWPLALGLVVSLLWLGAVGRSAGADLAAPLQPVLVTNYVLATNVVVVSITNYVVTTNAVLSTNFFASGRTNSRLPDVSWVPPADSFDWIQLKSGEWLKGRLKALQKRELEFDSEKLNLLKFDWKDVRQVRASHTQDVLFVDGEEVTGPVIITPDQVLFGGDEPLAYPRDQLQSVTPGGAKERNFWSGKVAAGLTLRAGNTKQLEFDAQAHLQRRTPDTRLSLDYIGNVSRVDGVESANDHRVNSEFDFWLSRKFYLVVPFAEYYRDPFQNLSSRITVGAGVGYDIIAKPKLEWSITSGPGYQHSWFESAQPGEPTQKGAAALVFATHFEWDITQRVEFILDYRGQYTSRQAGETTQHLVGTISLEMTKIFDLDVSLVWDRIANPKIGSDGVQPQPDDFRLVVGLGVDF